VLDDALVDANNKYQFLIPLSKNKNSPTLEHCNSCPPTTNSNSGINSSVSRHIKQFSHRNLPYRLVLIAIFLNHIQQLDRTIISDNIVFNTLIPQIETPVLRKYIVLVTGSIHSSYPKICEVEAVGIGATNNEFLNPD